MPPRTYRETILHAEGLELIAPDPLDVESQYRNFAENGEFIPFPYWTRLWPSSIALTRYIRTHAGMLVGRQVLELGAGLGLPSFAAAAFSKQVIVTDHIPESIEWMDNNIRKQGLRNVRAALADWTSEPKLKAEVVMMSDVSYDPERFDELMEMIHHYLDEGSQLIIAIPERIISGSFYGLIEAYIIDSTTYAIDDKRVVVASLAR
jgi:predicted nicotinamide N-methyase